MPANTVQLTQRELDQVLKAAGLEDRPLAALKLSSVGRIINPVTQGIWRADLGEFSFALKHLRRAEASADEAWCREVEAYRHPRALAFPPGLSTPRCYAVLDRGPDDLLLALEWLTDSAETWGTGDYVALAQRLGRWQAAPPPRQSWFDIHPFSGTLLDPGAVELALETVTDFPELKADLLAQLRQAGDLQAMFEQLPETVGHHDLWAANLFARPGEVVLIDLAFVGIGHLMEDAVKMAFDAVCLTLLPLPQGVAVFVEQVRDAYLAGLREGGWRGEERLLRRAFSAAAARRYGPHLLWLAQDPQTQEALCRDFLNVDSQQMRPRWTEAVRSALALGREALADI